MKQDTAPAAAQEKRFTVKEICLATGLKDHQVHLRRKNVGIETSKTGYSYDEIRRMMAYRSPTPGKKPRPAMVDKLKQMLKNDGFI
ncbi:MAG: hypothetical protein IKE24_05770 [Clostridia bacterium]|nr:hypothetical protein [Clostridia bacterium]